ncbi:Nucleotide-binding protein, UspA family [Halanaeroarchaeum sp. HSR-CO]|uniref:universal stress protein n=1 Tax=Halanaeroarchaeum sp. HSR-CO TaxID=2866382 RepID=UPI00217D055E|nr:universal stress protein [Halanaeroarchaeum sp. HSR-CO]UWG46335.1 Nucleotide-binding protein, UspA family [Halanaeroarchaeum sp. HSR-CO]
MTVLAAVDRDDADSGVVQEAKRLARALETDLVVLHVINRDDFVATELQSMEERDEPIQMDEMKQHAADIAERVGDVTDMAFESVGLVGDVPARVCDYATDIEADYVVIDGRKRTPIGKVVFSDVTQQILLNCTCPVVTVLHDKSEE